MGNDNGILDIETINNELMGQRNINTKPENSEVLNAKTTMNPLVSDSVTMEPVSSAMPNPVAMEPTNPVMPAPAAPEPINPIMPDTAATEAVSPVMPAPVAPEPINPVLPDFGDLEIQDNSQNFNQPAAPETIDSRSFTHTASEWKRIQEQEVNNYADNYVDPADSLDNYKESKPQNFFQVYFALLVSPIIAGVFVLLLIQFYNIEYISKLQCLLSMLPAMGLFYGFYYMTGKSKIPVPIGILFIVLNTFISYFTFHAVMAHGLQKMYTELSYKEAWQFVKMLRKIDGTKELYYTQFASIFGVGVLSGIIFGGCGIKGMLDVGLKGRGRY